MRGRIPASGRDHQRPDCRQDKLRCHGRPQDWPEQARTAVFLPARPGFQQAWGSRRRELRPGSIQDQHFAARPLQFHRQQAAGSKRACPAGKTRRQARWPFHFAADGSHLNRHRRATATIPARAPVRLPDLTGLRENPANSARKGQAGRQAPGREPRTNPRPRIF